MFNYEEEVQKYKIQQMKKNKERIIQEINNAKTRQKIENFIKRNDNEFTYDEVINGILTNPIILACFAIAPSRQSIEEKFTLQMLGLKKLSQSGKNSIRFTYEGDIVHKKNSGAVTKSVDCIYKNVYTTLKYTHEDGGSQNNQENDVRNFLLFGSKKNKVGAILDGAYWTKEKILSLREEFKNNSNVIFITSTEEILNGVM